MVGQSLVVKVHKTIFLMLIGRRESHRFLPKDRRRLHHTILRWGGRSLSDVQDQWLIHRYVVEGLHSTVVAPVHDKAIHGGGAVYSNHGSVTHRRLKPFSRDVFYHPFVPLLVHVNACAYSEKILLGAAERQGKRAVLRKLLGIVTIDKGLFVDVIHHQVQVAVVVQVAVSRSVAERWLV